jgi:hypothetical protein
MESKETGGKELPGNKELQVRLSTSFEPAQASLRALLDMPAFLMPEQTKKLKKLVGPEWTRLKVDIERHMAWSARAHDLLREIDGTRPDALSDAGRTALLSQADKAVYEAHLAARRIVLSQPSSTPTRQRPGIDWGLVDSHAEAIPRVVPTHLSAVERTQRALDEKLDGSLRRAEGSGKSSRSIRRIEGP